MGLPLLNRAWRGYLEVAVSGDQAVQLVQAVVAAGVPVWRLRRAGAAYHACLLARDYHRLRPFVRQYRARVRILGRRGLPFQVRSRARRAVFTGLIIFVGLLYVLGGFVWRIEITGAETTSRAEIIAALDAVGLRGGQPKRLVDTEAVEEGVLLAIPRLSWVGVELRGVVAHVQVIEKNVPGYLAGEMAPADVVAAKAGRVEALIVLAGQAQVVEGDQVEAGQVLISGDAPRWEYHGRTSPPGPQPAEVRARGLVRARVEYDLYGEVPEVLTIDRRTGRTYQRSVVRVGVRRLTLTGAAPPPFALWEEEREGLVWRDRNGRLLAELVSLTYYEVERTREELGPAGARREAEAMLRRDFGLMLPPGALIVGQQVESKALPHAAAVRLRVEVIEDIGLVRPR